MSMDFKKIWASIQADKAKWGSLCLFMALGLLLWGRLLLKDVPRVATANDKLSDGVAGLDLGEIGDDASAVNQAWEGVELVIPPRIVRDLFEVKPRYYQVIHADTEKESTQAKLPQVTVDDESGAGKRVSEAAASLSLQSTLLGQAPRALINGRLLGVGESIKGFKLLEVGVRQAKIQKDGVIVVLKMKSP